MRRRTSPPATISGWWLVGVFRRPGRSVVSSYVRTANARGWTSLSRSRRRLTDREPIRARQPGRGKANWAVPASQNPPAPITRCGEPSPPPRADGDVPEACLRDRLLREKTPSDPRLRNGTHHAVLPAPSRNMDRQLLRLHRLASGSRPRPPGQRVGRERDTVRGPPSPAGAARGARSAGPSALGCLTGASGRGDGPSADRCSANGRPTAARVDRRRKGPEIRLPVQ